MTTGTTATEAIWLAYNEALFNTQEQEWKALLAGPLWITAFSAWQKSSLRFTPTDKLGGIWAAQIETGHGTTYVIRDTAFKDSPYGSGIGYKGMMIGFEPKDIKYIHMKGRDLGLYYNQQAPGTDGQYDLMRAEAGFWFSSPENARVAEDFTAYS